MESAENKYDAALGSLLGAFVGDAAGATLEFMELITPADLQRAMEMRGGGIWQTAPGQITDDGEMALCLAHGLAQSPRFDLEGIARQYVRWVESHPFDIGQYYTQWLECLSASRLRPAAASQLHEFPAPHGGIIWGQKPTGA